MPADLERSPTEASDGAASSDAPPNSAPDAVELGAVWDRLLLRVENDLAPAERSAEQLLSTGFDAAERDRVAQRLQAISEWLADLGMVAPARGARALREHFEDLAVTNRRDVGAAVVAATLIEGVRASIETIGAAGFSTSAAGDQLVVVGEPSSVLDSLIWVAFAGGFSVHHRVDTSGWPDRADAVLVCDVGLALEVAAMAGLAARQRYGDVPLVVASERSAPRDRMVLADHASSILTASGRTADVIDELRRQLHASRRDHRFVVRGDLHEVVAADLADRGVPAVGTSSDREVLVEIESGRVNGALLLPADDNDAVVRLLRAQPATRNVTIVEVLDGRAEAASAGVDATIDGIDQIGAHAPHLAELLRQRSDLDIDLVALRTSAGVPWESATFLAERVLLSADRSESTVSVCVIRYPESVPVLAVDAVQEQLTREFRTDDIVTRSGGRENILVLSGVASNVAATRFHGILERASTPGARVGVAEFPHDGAAIGPLIDAARSVLDRSADVENLRVVTVDWRRDTNSGAEIIVADSDHGAAHVVRRALERMGRSVEHLNEGEALLERLRSPELGPPVLLILDFDLLGVDGLTVLRRLHKRAALRRFDVVMLASRAREADIQTAYDLGVADVIGKPFSPGILARRLQRLLASEA